eukprot:GHUV01012041.1.p1 GENE.GHUV01012041.1~~GHUV01012041.1.p1  ORF type:complete len:380 (+),score=62.57 GHUV01012041.1:611-1750(+)
MQHVFVAVERRARTDPGSSYSSMISNTRGMVYFGVPHGGSQLANLAKAISPAFLGFARPAAFLEHLAIHDWDAGYQRHIFQQVKRFAGTNTSRFKTLALYETVPTTVKSTLLSALGALAFNGLVVEKNSATTEMDYIEPVPDANHLEVCKPPTPQDTRYLRLKAFIKEATAEAPSLRLPPDSIGLDGLCDGLLRCLPDTGEGVAVAIVGQGGMGKTTLARALYNRLKPWYPGCKASAVYEQTWGQDLDEKAMFCDLAEQLGLGHLHSLETARPAIAKTVTQGGVLLLLDNLDSSMAQRLVNFSPEIFQPGPDGVTIITSRDQTLPSRHSASQGRVYWARTGAIQYQMLPMAAAAASELFEKKAGKRSAEFKVWLPQRLM